MSKNIATLVLCNSRCYMYGASHGTILDKSKMNVAKLYPKDYIQKTCSLNCSNVAVSNICNYYISLDTKGGVRGG